MLEIVFSIVVAYILSLLVSFVLYFAFSGQYASYVNYASGIVFGLAFGYKLKEIISRK